MALTQRQKEIRLQVRYRTLNKRYKIGDCIGNGTYGLVFFGVDIECQMMPVAIKVIDLQHYTSEHQKEKHMIYCKEEVKSMKSCSGEHIMKCFEVFIEKNLKVKIIVLEYCMFDSLEMLIFEKGCLPQIEAKKILVQVLFGLSEFHRKGRIHRDIKSGNICISKDRIVLADFGCSKMFLTQNEKGKWRSTINKIATNIGTKESRSPEMLSNQQYGLKTDLWSIGILYYQMLMGFPPFYFEEKNADPLMVIKENIQNIFIENYQQEMFKKHSVTGTFRKLSQEGEDFLRNLICINPKERYGWKELLEDQYLKKISSDEFYPKCILPLSEKSWENIIIYLKTLQQREENIGKEDIDEDQNVQEAHLVLKGNEIKTLTEIQEKVNQVIMNNLLEIKKIQFELRRIELLMKVYDELTDMKKSQLLKLRLLVIKICFLKYSKIEFSSEQSLTKNLYNEKFKEELYKRYQAVGKEAQEKANEYKQMFKSIFVQTSIKKKIENYNIQTLCEMTVKQIKKRQDLFNGQNQSKNFSYFWKHSEKLFQLHDFTYYNQSQFTWPSWKNLSEMHTIIKKN